MKNYPGYLKSYHNGYLKEVADKAYAMLESCSICPRKCKVNRLKNELGFCKTGLLPRVYSYLIHNGEEPPVSGTCGSGTIFFSGCNMACAYCQNFEFSQKGEGREVSFEKLADIMLQLQESCCHNINLVTPTHVMPQILKALAIAVPKGLKVPLIYNTGGYELPEIIKLLKGIIDIYLADMRYADDNAAIKYSGAVGYPGLNRSSVKQMHVQCGNVEMDKEGLIRKGLIIRHLVLPQGISGTEITMKFIAKKLSKETYISLMSQYAPYHKACESMELSRRITAEEYKNAQELMESCGLHNGWTQESGGLERLAGVNIKQVLE